MARSAIRSACSCWSTPRPCAVFPAAWPGRGGVARPLQDAGPRACSRSLRRDRPDVFRTGPGVPQSVVPHPLHRITAVLHGPGYSWLSGPARQHLFLEAEARAGSDRDSVDLRGHGHRRAIGRTDPQNPRQEDRGGRRHPSETVATCSLRSCWFTPTIRPRSFRSRALSGRGVADKRHQACG